MALFHQGNDRIQVWQIGIASALLVVGFCMASLSIPLIYSDMIGARLESVGLRSGWFFGLSSLAVRARAVSEWGGRLGDAMCVWKMCNISPSRVAPLYHAHVFSSVFGVLPPKFTHTLTHRWYAARSLAR